MKKFILIITLATITQCAYSADESAISEDQREFINLFFKAHIELDKNLSLKMKNNPDTVRTFLNSLRKGGELYESYYNYFFETQNIISQAKSLEELMVNFGYSMAFCEISALQSASNIAFSEVIKKNNIEGSDLKIVHEINNLFMKALNIQTNLNFARQKEMLLRDTDSPDLFSMKNEILVYKKTYTLLQKKNIKSLDKNQFEPIFEKKMKTFRKSIKKIISEKKLNDSKVKKELNDPEITRLSLIALSAASEFNFDDFQYKKTDQADFSFISPSK